MKDAAFYQIFRCFWGFSTASTVKLTGGGVLVNQVECFRGPLVVLRPVQRLVGRLF
jgi:hypothetical protein